jgi:hypothetical protein
MSFFDAVHRLWAETMAGFWRGGDLGSLLGAVNHDQQLKRRFVEDPGAVLAERGVRLPEGITLKVLENTSTTLHLVLPPLVTLDESTEAAK